MSKSVKKGEQVLRLENIQAISLLSVQLIRSLGLELLGIRGQDVIITSILLQKDLDIVLPVMEVHIDGIQCTAVMGTSCSHTLMSRSVCHLWRKRGVMVLIADIKNPKCCGGVTSA